MKTVLVTGGGGYIGSVLCSLLLEEGFRVVTWDRFFFGQSVIKPLKQNPRFSFARKDIRACTKSDFDEIDVVCDLAALSNDPSGELDQDLTCEINHHGRARLASLAKDAGVSQYVLASSCSVYGDGGDGVLTEETVPAPITTYAEANYRAEQATRSLASDNFCVTALRQATVYGLSRRMRFDLVVNIMTLHAYQKQKLFVLGEGQQWRPLVHVEDTARAFLTVINADPATVNDQVFNVGSNEQNFRVVDIAYLIQHSLPDGVSIEFVPADDDNRNYKVAFDKIHQVLGYETRREISESAAEIYEALRTGSVCTDERTVTVKWYKHLLEAQRILEENLLDGKLLHWNATPVYSLEQHRKAA